MRKAIWLVSACGCVALATVEAQRARIKPIASIMELHEAMISPSSDAIFDVGREAPTNDKEWTAVRNHAVILAESANMLMLEGRAKDAGAWMKFSTALADAAAAALRAARTKNLDGVLEAGDQIVPFARRAMSRTGTVDGRWDRLLVLSLRASSFVLRPSVLRPSVLRPFFVLRPSPSPTTPFSAILQFCHSAIFWTRSPALSGLRPASRTRGRSPSKRSGEGRVPNGGPQAWRQISTARIRSRSGLLKKQRSID